MKYKLRGILLVIFGVVLVAAGFVAVYLLFMQQKQAAAVQPTPEPVATQNVVVVTHDMFLGDLVKAEDLTTVEMPSHLIPRDAVTAQDMAVDKYLKTDLVQGEMLLQHNLADPTNINHDLAFTLADDHVLYAISFNDVMTSNSVIQRGDIVDIFITRTETVPAPVEEGQPAPAPDEEEETLTRAFTFDAFQKVNVTALVMDIVTAEEEAAEPVGAPERGEIRIQAYLLALPPQDALILKHLKDTGAVFDIVLRSPTSTGDFDLTPVTQEYIVEYYGLEILP